MRRLTACALAVLVVACAPDRIRVRAARDLECAAGRIETTQIDDSRIRALGCGRSATYYCSVDSRGEDVCTREKPNPRVAVQKAADADLLCPAEKIAVDDVAEGFVATGCGRTATYACREIEGGHRCEKLGPPSLAKPKVAPSPPR